MTRVAVIGNAGGGKTTFCHRLGRKLNLPVFAVDAVQWKPGWQAASMEEVTAIHRRWLNYDRWIIDGFGGWDNIRVRFDAADTIIFIDYPLYIHYWWSIKRQVTYAFRPRPDLPENCPMLPMTWPLLQMIWHVHKFIRPQLMKLIDEYRDAKQVIHITAPRQLEIVLQGTQ